MDANRSFYTIPDAETAFAARAHLAAVLLKFVGHSAMSSRSHRYFQGLHDIAAVVMVATNNEDVAALVLVELACTKLEPLFTGTLSPMLGRPLAVVAQAEPRLMAFLRRGDASPLFVHRWLTTWFAHDIDDPATAQRVFDHLLASDFTQGFYLSAALMCLGGDALMRDVPCEMGSIHKFFCELPGKITTSSTANEDDSEGINAAALVSKSIELRSMFPIDFDAVAQQEEEEKEKEKERMRNSTGRKMVTKKKRGNVWKKPPKLWVWVVVAIIAVFVLSKIYQRANRE